MEYKQQSTRATGRQISWQSKSEEGQRERGREEGATAANNRRWSVLLKQFRRIYFWPQKRNAEQSGLTTIKVMLTNNPRRDWEGLTAAEAESKTGRQKERERKRGRKREVP